MIILDSEKFLSCSGWLKTAMLFMSFLGLFFQPEMAHARKSQSYSKHSHVNSLSASPTRHYYRNSRGVMVQSPFGTSTGKAPSGASARCRDGSYGFSQSRRGTCSHHGGVSGWL